LDAKADKDKNEMLSKTYGFVPTYYDIIDKFRASSKKQEPQKVFKGPQVPDNFNPKHKTEETVKKDDNDSMSIYLKTATARGELLDEEFIKPVSVFDLLNEKDREFLKKKTEENPDSIVQREKMLAKQKTTEVQLKEAKEKRYEQFVSAMKRNLSEPYGHVETRSLTEWEIQHEKDEFKKRYDLQTKQSEKFLKNMEKKFVSGEVLYKFNDVCEASQNIVDETVVDKKKLDKSQSEVEKAAEEKRFGLLTRVECTWIPHNIICKRFNVPNPYPEFVFFLT
jgi:G patch domain-containing protein 1